MMLRSKKCHVWWLSYISKDKDVLIFRDEEDPKHNTRAQKTWIPGDDPGLKALDQKLGYTANEEDTTQDRKQKMKSS